MQEQNVELSCISKTFCLLGVDVEDSVIKTLFRTKVTDASLQSFTSVAELWSRCCLVVWSHSFPTDLHCYCFPCAGSDPRALLSDIRVNLKASSLAEDAKSFLWGFRWFGQRKLVARGQRNISVSELKGTLQSLERVRGRGGAGPGQRQLQLWHLSLLVSKILSCMLPHRTWKTNGISARWLYFKQCYLNEK